MSDNVITVDDKEYNVDEMTEEQQYFVAQLRNLNGKMQNIRYEADQLNAAQNSFTAALTASLTAEGEEKDDS